MRLPSASELLAIWEDGAAAHPVERAILVLTACTLQPRDAIASMAIGERDARLFDIYQGLFGAELEAYAECSACGERLEYRLHVDEIRRPACLPNEEGALRVSCGDISLELRDPNSLDLEALAACDNPASARRRLAERCILHAARGECAITPETLSDDVVEEISSCLAQADPRAEVLIDLTCPACGTASSVMLAIETFLWAKIGVLAKRLLREVDVLARAYGWSERDILAMSAARRRNYLELAVT
jgi:hypothetical protein